ncbi:MAG: PilZ domain-containing protein [Azoarcus sp.]|jgi:hypothetical protein|nr:PilZ domain-containing protein [Azoarcus sp.]
MNIPQRRRFSRVRFCNAATFQVGCGQWPCKILDLSLHGALITVESVDVAKSTPCLLELCLDSETYVRMQGHVAHHSNNLIGIACDETDLDSINHLRHLLALNLGDSALMEREFSALLTAHQQEPSAPGL